MTTTMNLATGEEVMYSGLTPVEAVIAAYAQEKGDWNTWNYRRLYSHLVRTGRFSVGCGDWTALIEEVKPCTTNIKR